MQRREWSIQELARAAGTTSRTLRHYQDRDLLRPSRTGANGMRYYDGSALPTLLRILVLRELGLGLDPIRRVLADGLDPATALRGHVADLEHQRDRLTRQIASVRRTVEQLEGGEELMAEQTFEGFDHTQYREEVEQRWGKDAYERGDRWWRGMSEQERAEFKAEGAAIGAAYRELAAAGAVPDCPEASEVVRRHVAQLRAPMGTVSRDYLIGLGDLYVADPRFGANYPGYVEFVRDAMHAYAVTHLPA